MMLIYLGLFILGSIFGSFLSVIIHRIRNEQKGILFGRSKCPMCQAKLTCKDLIPIFSFLFQKGRCRYCKEKIGSHYFFIELLTGLIFLAFFWKFPFLLFSPSGVLIFDLTQFYYYLFYVVIGFFLTGIFFYDLRFLEIPEIFTFPAIAIIIIANAFLFIHDWQTMLIGGATAALFFGLQVLVSDEKWLGSGDTQVGIIMGLLLGWKLLFVALILTYFFGTFISVLLVTTGKATGKSKISFAPFLVIGTFITIFFGEYLLNFYIQSLII